jgi:hypothetical protein
MKIVKLLGGLGNQMFQYALYLSLKELFSHEVVKVDCSYFNGYSRHNGLELSRVFAITDLPRHRSENCFQFLGRCIITDYGK